MLPTSILLCLALLAPPGAAGQPALGDRHAHPPPAELTPAIAGAIAPGGWRLTIAKTGLDFWFVKGLPVKAADRPPAWRDVDEGSLLGAVRIDAAFPDVRGRVIKPGVYTLRYGIQPENGDHLGVSPFREFVLLVPAALDTAAAPLGHDGAIDVSKRTVGGSHPAVWSIDPPSTGAPLMSPHTTDAGLTSFTMEIPAARAGQPSGAIRFGLVLIGKIEA